MALTLATRLSFSIAKTMGAAFNITSASNASECVLTMALAVDASITPGSYVLIYEHSWSRLRNKVVRVKSVSGSTITLEALDTTDTLKFPTYDNKGGKLRKIADWERITNIKNVTSSGGDQQFTDGTTLDDDTEVKVPTIRSARDMTLEVFDDPDLAWYATVMAVSESSQPRPLMMTSPNGLNVIVGNAYWSMSDEPKVMRNELLTTEIKLTYASQTKRYAVT